MIGAVPVQVPGSAVSVEPSSGGARDRRRARVRRSLGLHLVGLAADVAESRAAVVGRGHHHAEGRADVRGHERVGRAGRPADVRAVGAGRVAAAPLVGVGDRRRARPGPVRGRQRLAVASPCPRSTATPCWPAGPPATAGLAAEVAETGPSPFVAVTTRRSRRADVGRHQRVGRARGACDVRADRTREVAAPPLVAVGDRRRAGPGAVGAGERLPVLRRARDRRQRRVGGREPVHHGARGGGCRGRAAVVHRGHDHAESGTHVGRHERIARTRRAADVHARGTRRIAAPPLVAERQRRGAGPAAVRGAQRLPVHRGPRDRGQRGVRGRGGLRPRASGPPWPKRNRRRWRRSPPSRRVEPTSAGVSE